MGDKSESVIPPLALDVSKLLLYIPTSLAFAGLVKRLRIAVTEEELAELKKYSLETSGRFVHAIRGLPVHIEVAPENPAYIVELPEPVSEATLSLRLRPL